MNKPNKVIEKRHEFVYLFDVINGNPNGDPDAGNAPRVDAETGIGQVSDVAIKRAVRDYVAFARENQTPNKIYIADKAVLSTVRGLAYEGLTENEKGDKQTAVAAAQRFMCNNYWDVRAYGAVMSGKTNNCDRITGPVQITVANSVDPIFAPHWSITRLAVETEADREKQRTFGSKYVVPYALYRCEGFISAFEARKSGFGEADLDLLWEALVNMFDHRHSANRGKMNARKLIVFKHDNALGRARSQDLFDLIWIKRITDGEAPARGFSDYQVNIDKAGVPRGVELLEIL